AFNGQRRQAIEVFRRLHTQMPHIRPDPDTFNPDVVELYDSAAPPDARSPSGSVSINSDPPGAVVYVDFLARGRTPTTVEGLIGGDHIIRVSRPGAAPFVEPLSVRRGRAASSNAFLADRDQSLAGLTEALSHIPEADVDRITDGSPIG